MDALTLLTSCFKLVHQVHTQSSVGEAENTSPEDEQHLRPVHDNINPALMLTTDWPEFVYFLLSLCLLKEDTHFDNKLHYSGDSIL